MRLCVPVLALAILGTACRTTGSKVGVTFASIGAAAGFVYGIACADYTTSDHRCESAESHVLGAGILIAIIGGIALTIGSELSYHPAESHAVIARPAPPQPERSDAALYEPIQARDPIAHQLAIQAHEAAVRRECAPVPIMGKRVRELDAEYHARVFVADPAIARCLR